VVLLNVATPDALTLLVPTMVAPLKKFTVPMGAPIGVGVTVAVMVTDCPNVDGLGAAISAVVVAVMTTRLCAGDVEVAKLILPEYVAVRLSVPCGSAAVLSVATPLPLTLDVPMLVAPLKKSTVPSGVPVGVGVMVAVSVTVWPAMTGFGATPSAVVVAALLTVKLTAADVEVAKLALPEYTAVRLSTPTGSAAVESVATPEALTFPLPMLVAPLKKLTVPSKAPVGIGVMVAVRVTEAPKVEGLAEVVSTVVEVAGLTVKLTGADVEALKLVSPEYTAVRFCVPLGKAVVIKAAVPPLTATGEPITVLPVLKVTVPLGEPLNCGLIVAVSVIDWPNVEGLAEVASTMVVLALLTTCGVPVSVPVLPL